LIYAVARDITEQRNTQELMIRQSKDLARSNADLEQFANVASHDLRAPLRAVANLAEWIEEDMPGELPRGVKINLEKLRSTVQRMERLTDGILKYSRVGREPDEIRVVDADSLLRELVMLLSPPEGFKVSWDPGLPVFETAALPLEQVFRNLISNAIKHHHRPDGKVVIAVRSQSQFYEFSVADDGPGIAADYHEKIFEMFQKGRPSTHVEGNGIGLALVKKTVEGYGGRVWVDSTEGSGATFRFTWPKRINPTEGHFAGNTDS
jgi:signal transduction histidine kinase